MLNRRKGMLVAWGLVAGAGAAMLAPLSAIAPAQAQAAPADSGAAMGGEGKIIAQNLESLCQPAAMKAVASTLAIKVTVQRLPQAEMPGPFLLGGTKFTPAKNGLAAYCQVTGSFESKFGTMTAEEVRARFLAVLGPRGDAALQVYRDAAPDDPPTYWLTAMLTDRTFRMSALIEADLKADQHAAPVVMYRVDYQPNVAGRVLRSPHGTEMPSMFGNLRPEGFIGTDPGLARLSDQTMEQWINFASNGDPSIERLPWPRYTTATRQTMIIDTVHRVVPDPDKATRKYWDA